MKDPMRERRLDEGQRGLTKALGENRLPGPTDVLESSKLGDFAALTSAAAEVGDRQLQGQ